MNCKLFNKTIKQMLAMLLAAAMVATSFSVPVKAAEDEGLIDEPIVVTEEAVAEETAVEPDQSTEPEAAVEIQEEGEEVEPEEAVMTTYDPMLVKKANLADHANASLTEAQLCTNYALAVTAGDGDDEYNIAITGSNLKLHQNAAGENGYWVGVGFPTANAGHTYTYKAKFSKIEDTDDYNTKAEGVMDGDANADGYNSLYVNVGSKNIVDSKVYINVKDTSTSGEVRIYKYTVDVSGVKLDTTPTVAPLVDQDVDPKLSLYDAGSYTLDNISQSGNFTEVTINASNLVKHTAGENNDTWGYWVGIAVPQQATGTEYRQTLSGTTPNWDSDTFYNADSTCAIGEGVNAVTYDTIYYNLDDLGDATTAYLWVRNATNNFYLKYKINFNVTTVKEPTFKVKVTNAALTIDASTTIEDLQEALGTITLHKLNSNKSGYDTNPVTGNPVLVWDRNDLKNTAKYGDFHTNYYYQLYMKKVVEEEGVETESDLDISEIKEETKVRVYADYKQYKKTASEDTAISTGERATITVNKKALTVSVNSIDYPAETTKADAKTTLQNLIFSTGENGVVNLEIKDAENNAIDSSLFTWDETPTGSAQNPTRYKLELVVGGVTLGSTDIVPGTTYKGTVTATKYSWNANASAMEQTSYTSESTPFVITPVLPASLDLSAFINGIEIPLGKGLTEVETFLAGSDIKALIKERSDAASSITNVFWGDEVIGTGAKVNTIKALAKDTEYYVINSESTPDFSNTGKKTFAFKLYKGKRGSGEYNTKGSEWNGAEKDTKKVSVTVVPEYRISVGGKFYDTDATLESITVAKNTTVAQLENLLGGIKVYKYSVDAALIPDEVASSDPDKTKKEYDNKYKNYTSEITTFETSAPLATAKENDVYVKTQTATDAGLKSGSSVTNTVTIQKVIKGQISATAAYTQTINIPITLVDSGKLVSVGASIVSNNTKAVLNDIRIINAKNIKFEDEITNYLKENKKVTAKVSTYDASAGTTVKDLAFTDLILKTDTEALNAKKKDGKFPAGDYYLWSVTGVSGTPKDMAYATGSFKVKVEHHKVTAEAGASSLPSGTSEESEVLYFTIAPANGTYTYNAGTETISMTVEKSTVETMGQEIWEKVRQNKIVAWNRGVAANGIIYDRYIAPNTKDDKGKYVNLEKNFKVGDIWYVISYMDDWKTTLAKSTGKTIGFVLTPYLAEYEDATTKKAIKATAITALAKNITVNVTVTTPAAKRYNVNFYDYSLDEAVRYTPIASMTVTGTGATATGGVVEGQLIKISDATPEINLGKYDYWINKATGKEWVFDTDVVNGDVDLISYDTSGNQTSDINWSDKTKRNFRVSIDPVYNYTGKAIKPVPVVNEVAENGSVIRTLTKKEYSYIYVTGADAKVTPKQVGSYKLKVTVKDSDAKVKADKTKALEDVAFEIVPLTLDENTPVDLTPKTVTLNDKNNKGTFALPTSFKANGIKLKLGEDYTADLFKFGSQTPEKAEKNKVTFSKATDAGNYELYITIKNSEANIAKKAVKFYDDGEIVIPVCVMKKAQQVDAAKVKFDKITQSRGRNDAAFTITMADKDSKTKKPNSVFRIDPAAMTSTNKNNVCTYTYTNEKTNVTFTVTYTDSRSVGKVYVTVKGDDKTYFGEKTWSYNVAANKSRKLAKSMTKKLTTAIKTGVDYTGKAWTLEEVIQDPKFGFMVGESTTDKVDTYEEAVDKLNELIPNAVYKRDYTLSYAKNINAGNAVVTFKAIAGSGYSGSFSINVKINKIKLIDPAVLKPADRFKYKNSDFKFNNKGNGTVVGFISDSKEKKWAITDAAINQLVTDTLRVNPSTQLSKNTDIKVSISVGKDKTDATKQIITITIKGQGSYTGTVKYTISAPIYTKPVAAPAAS